VLQARDIEEREEGEGVDGGGRWHPLNNNNNNNNNKATAAGATEQQPGSWRRRLGGRGVPQGSRLGPPAQEAFCQLRAAGLQGQSGHGAPGIKPRRRPPRANRKQLY